MVPLRIRDLGSLSRAPWTGRTIHALGQETALNRLLDIRVGVIRSRIGLKLLEACAKSAGQVGNLCLNVPTYKGLFNLNVAEAMAELPISPSDWSDDEMEAMEKAATSPSSEELKIISLLNLLFEKWKSGISPSALERGGGRAVTSARDIRLPLPTLNDVPSAYNPQFMAGFSGQLPMKPFWFIESGAWLFGIENRETWADEGNAAWNAEALLGELGNYPFPSPIPGFPKMFYDIAKSSFAEAVHNPGRILDPEVARFAITLIVLKHYNEAAKAISEALKEEAEERAKQAKIDAIALAVVGLVIGVALPVAIAIGYSAVTTAFEVQQARDASRDLARTSKLFARSDAAFAEEVQKAAGIIDAQAAREEALRPGTEPPPGKGVDLTALLVGGGIATVGLFALLR